MFIKTEKAIFENYKTKIQCECFVKKYMKLLGCP